MPSTVTTDISPSDLLGRFRGPVFDARHGYPETMQLKVTDGEGGVWWLTTFDSQYTPSDPDDLLGKAVVGAGLDERSGLLTVDFADGSAFRIVPNPLDPEYDLTVWSLFTPDGMVLIWGPGDRREFRKASSR